MDVRICQNSDNEVFREIAAALLVELGGVWTNKFDGLDQAYWDLLVQSSVLTLHREHYTGVFLQVSPEVPGALVERAAAAVPSRGDWSFLAEVSGLFVAHPDRERGPLASELTQDCNHIHGALVLRVGGRAIPRLGFWGPDDVCLKTWLAELRRALAQLDEQDSSVYSFDEGEQGQPEFRFRRDGTRLLVSVADSVLSGACGEPNWVDVPCDYDDFRFQVLRLFGSVRRILEREIGARRAVQWLKTVDAAETRTLNLS